MGEIDQYEDSSSEEEYSSNEEEEETNSEEEEETEEEEEEEEQNEKEKKEVETKRKEVEKIEEKKDHLTLPKKKTTFNSSFGNSSVMSSDKDNSGARKMTHQRKSLLKSMMLNKAREELKREAERKAEEKKAALSKRLEPLGNTSSMSQQDLMDLCRELHAKIDKVDEQRFDIEARVKKNDQEIEDLNQKIFDLRGKFKRPPLRRVRVSADQMLRALLGSKHKVSMDLRSNLKSVKKEGTKKEDAEVKDWRDNIEAKQGMGGKMAVFEGAKE